VAGVMKATVWPSPLIAGWMLTLLARVPSMETLTRTVAGTQLGVVVEPRQVLRTKESSKLLLSPETRLVASEEKAMNWASPAELVAELTLGFSLRALPGTLEELETETSWVEVVQPEMAVPQVSRRKICWTPELATWTRLVAAEAKAT